MDFVFMSENQSENIYIRNKCSKMCVCRIMLQNIYVNIQIIELWLWYFQRIRLTLWWNVSLSWMQEVDDTELEESKIDMLPEIIWDKYGANFLTLC